jgi:hypothetical protein
VLLNLSEHLADQLDEDLRFQGFDQEAVSAKAEGKCRILRVGVGRRVKYKRDASQRSCPFLTHGRAENRPARHEDVRHDEIVLPALCESECVEPVARRINFVPRPRNNASSM